MLWCRAILRPSRRIIHHSAHASKAKRQTLCHIHLKHFHPKDLLAWTFHRGREYCMYAQTVFDSPFPPALCLWSCGNHWPWFEKIVWSILSFFGLQKFRTVDRLPTRWWQHRQLCNVVKQFELRSDQQLASALIINWAEVILLKNPWKSISFLQPKMNLNKLLSIQISKHSINSETAKHAKLSSAHFILSHRTWSTDKFSQ